MTWDSVPWFVGGGAEHSPEVARLLAYAATSGAEGTVAPDDLKVVPLSVPGSSVRVLPGAALILNRAQGGAQQTYVGRLPTEDVVDIAATGSGAGRSDLIVAEIMDPYVAGSPFQTPSDVKVGPYIRTRVVSNVAAGTTTVPAGITGIALARIDLPASTGTVTGQMIVSLRSLAQPRAESRTYGGPPGVGAWTYTSANTHGNGDAFETAAFPVKPQIDVPSWATHVDIIADSSVEVTAGSAGMTLTRLGSTIYGQPINWSGNPVTLTAADVARPVPVEMRGTRQELSMRARVDSGQLSVITWAVCSFSVHFYERAV